AVTGRGKTGRTRRRVPAGGPPLPGAGGGRIAGAQWPVAGPDATPRRLPAQPAAAVVRRAPRAARRVGGRTPGDPRPARCAPRALVTGRGPGRPLLSGRGCRLGGLARTLRRLACLRLVPHPDTLLVATHLEQVRCLDQVAELAVAVIARVERGLVADLLAHRAQVGPAVLAAGELDCAPQPLQQPCVAAQLGRGARLLGGGGRATVLLAQRLDVCEHRAGVDERVRRLLLAEAVDLHPVGQQPHHQRGEVGIAGDDREPCVDARDL